MQKQGKSDRGKWSVMNNRYSAKEKEIILDKEEEEEEEEEDIMQAIEAGDYEVVDDPKKAEKFSQAAAKTLQKKKQRTIRIKESTISYFKSLSEKTGVPYQTLINDYLDEAPTREKLEKILEKINKKLDKVV